MRCAPVFVWGAVLMIGCGEDERPRPEPAAEVDPPAEERVAEEEAPAAEEPADPPPAGEERTVNVDVPSGTCVLRASGDAVSAECSEGSSLTCSAITRADLMPDAGEEQVFRCINEDDGAYIVAVVATSAILPIDLVVSCEAPSEREIRVVDVVADAPRELLAHRGECTEPGGNSPSADAIYKWQEGAGMVQIAEATVDCEWTGDTSGETDTPDAPYVCSGSALELGGTTEAPTVTEIEYSESTVPNATDTPTVAARHALSWSAETYRFARPE
jgi:hypothetical protein